MGVADVDLMIMVADDILDVLSDVIAGVERYEADDDFSLFAELTVDLACKGWCCWGCWAVISTEVCFKTKKEKLFWST